MAAPVNDTCATATVIATLPYITVVDTREATDDPVPGDGDPGYCGTGDGHNGVWYTLVVPETVSSVVLSLDDLDTFEGVLTLFSGTCGDLTYVNCTAGTDTFGQPVMPGTQLYILLTTWSPGGLQELGLTVQAGEPDFPEGDFCDVPVDLSPSPSPSGSESASPSMSPSPSPEPPLETRLIRRLRQSPHLSDEQFWFYVSQFQLDLETGRGLVTGQGIDPQIMLQWSDDGGHTWSNEHWVSAGLQGQYAWRAVWRRLGNSRDRVWRVVMSDPVPWHLLDAYVQVEKGTS